MPNYQLRVYDTLGQLLHVTDRFRSAVIEHRVNYSDTLTLGMYELNPIAQYLQANLDSIVELRRAASEAQLAWYTEYVGLHRTNQIEWTTANSRVYTSYSRGLLDLIRRRSIRYFSDIDCGLPNPLPADDAIKALVRANAGAAALAVNGRATDGVTPGLTVQVDASQAADYQGNHQGKNLLDAIREIGPPNKVDFDVVWSGPTAATSFEFQTYWPFKGTDRRAVSLLPTVFAPNLGNMANPSHTKSRTEEVTSAAVYANFGDVTLATSASLSDSPWNWIEQDRDARGEDRAQALQNMAEQILFERRAPTSFRFDVIQTPSSMYGKHYFVGDIVTGRFSTVSGDVKIRACTLDINQSGERLTLELEEYVP